VLALCPTIKDTYYATCFQNLYIVGDGDFKQTVALKIA
jgi:hypothetical protein